MNLEMKNPTGETQTGGNKSNLKEKREMGRREGKGKEKAVFYIRPIFFLQKQEQEPGTGTGKGTKRKPSSSKANHSFPCWFLGYEYLYLTLRT